MDKIVHLRVIKGWQIDCLHIEGLLRDAVRQYLYVSIPGLYVDEIKCPEDRSELSRKEFGILLADTEDNHVTDVAENRIARLFVYLGEELVRHRERELVLARF